VPPNIAWLSRREGQRVAPSLKSGGTEPLFFWYVAGMSAIALIASLLMPDTRIWGYLDGTGHVEDAPVLKAA
jgi:hypothetical protein